MLQRGDGARRVISDLNKLRYVPRISSSNDDSNGDSPEGSCYRRWGMRTRGVENMNVIYLRYKGRKTGFPSAETTFELVHCLLLHPSVTQGERERKEGGRKEDQLGAQGGWLLREERRSGESKKYYIINTDPRVQWGRWVSAWSALPSSTSLLLSISQPSERASHPPLPPSSYAKDPRLSPTLSYSPFRARTTLRAFQPLGVP